MEKLSFPKFVCDKYSSDKWMSDIISSQYVSV